MQSPIMAEWLSEEREVDLIQVICGRLGPYSIGVINKGYSAAGYSKFKRNKRMVALMEIAMVTKR